MLLFALLFQTLPAQHFPPVAQPGAAIDLTGQAAALCQIAPPLDAGRLLRRETAITDSLRRHDNLATWDHLACARAALAGLGTLSHESLDMPPGESWEHGATDAATHVLGRAPDDTTAASLLGLLLLDDPTVADLAPDRALLFRAARAGVRTRSVLRACDDLAWRVHDTTITNACADAALARGVDSTWHLVLLSRVAFAAADTTKGMQLFEDATAAAHDSASKQEIDWELQWFLTPDEETEWHALADTGRARWIRDRLMARDVRDDRPAGARLAEHFKRLEYVEENFRLAVPRRILSELRTGPAAQLEPSPCDDEKRCDEPGSAWSQQWREYNRWQTDFDDRGVVWMRYGPPDHRVPWVCPIERCVIAREVWMYDIDGQHLLLNFENEDFSGSVQPTRLVVGVLGSYLCDVDTERCRLTTLSKAAAHSGTNPVTPEQIDLIRREDRVAISDVTTTDDNSIHAAPLDIDARLFRFWDPSSGALRGVVTYGLRPEHLKPGPVTLDVNQWDAGAGARRDTTLTTNIGAGSDRAAPIVGAMTVTSSAGVTAWGVTATQGARRGRMFDDDAAPLSGAHVMLSDLIPGVASQGLTTRIGEESVELAPLDQLHRKELLHLFYQTRSDSAQAVRVDVAFAPAPPPGAIHAELKPALAISTDERVATGITAHRQSINVSRLHPGRYDLVVRIATPAGRELSERQTSITIAE